MSSSGKNNCWGFSYWPGSWWLNFMWDLALIFLNIHEPVPTLIYSSAFKNENRKTWLCARCYSHWSLAKEEILMNSNSLEQFRKILSLITDKKKKKGCPFPSFFSFVLQRFAREFWSFYHSPEQAQRCSVCLGCALEFRSYILMLIRPTSSLWPAVCCFLFLCNPCQYYKMTYSLSRKTLEYTKWSVEWVLPVFWQDNKWNTCAIQSKQVCGKDFSV